MALRRVGGVLQAELVEQREDPQAVDVIRREQHVHAARILHVTLDDQVLGEQLDESMDALSSLSSAFC